MNGWTFSPESSQARKKPPPLPPYICQYVYASVALWIHKDILVKTSEGLSVYVCACVCMYVKMCWSHILSNQCMCPITTAERSLVSSCCLTRHLCYRCQIVYTGVDPLKSPPPPHPSDQREVPCSTLTASAIVPSMQQSLLQLSLMSLTVCRWMGVQTHANAYLVRDIPESKNFLLYFCLFVFSFFLFFFFFWGGGDSFHMMYLKYQT